MLASPRTLSILRGLLWLYYLLWIFEGSLRKWFLPQLSDPLLLIRDPVLLLIYGIAFANQLFPKGNLLFFATFLGVIATLAGLLTIPESPGVVAFGVRTDFLYLPLIFLIPKLWNRDDVERLGRFTLIIGILMAPLIIAQFAGSPDSPLNVGVAGRIGGQINSARGHIRPAGTFSYVLGPCCLYSLVASFLIAVPFASKSKTPAWLVATSAIALITATISSGSRIQLISVGIVLFLGSFVALILKPGLFWRFLGAALLLTVAITAASQLSFFAEGTATLSDRLYGGADSFGEGVQKGLVDRVMDAMDQASISTGETPLFGKGIGTGTIAGYKLASSSGDVSWVEEEWVRVEVESGPIIGTAIILLRIVIMVVIGAHSIGAIKRQGNALPLLILAAAVPPFLYGQWGQTTMLGFSVFAAGLSIAAAVIPPLTPPTRISS